MILSMGGKENRMSEIPAVTDFYRKFMYGIIARSSKFCDVHLLYVHLYALLITLFVGC